MVDGKEMLTPCSPGAPGAKEMSLWDIEPDQLLEPPLVLKDFMKAVKASRPSVSAQDLEKNDAWTREFGEEGS